MTRKRKQTHQDAATLRRQYTDFCYENIYTDVHANGDGTIDLQLNFNYHINQLDNFTHRVTFHGCDRDSMARHNKLLYMHLAYHLGMIEAFSYWKLTAAPNFYINAAPFHDEQLEFWRDLLLNGMGEYFYVNKMDFTARNFVTFHNIAFGPVIPPLNADRRSDAHSLVNLGGGKDSAVMLSLLGGAKEKFTNLICHPASPAADKQAGISGRPTVYVTRKFDPKLQHYNQLGFLNGHVPFSASLAFINLLAAVAHGASYCLVGNESSSDEDSLMWGQQPINHQYSKSTKFEQSFQDYCSQYLIKNVKYFSFLRPFNEFQIAQLFCTNPTYWLITKSCNKGQQQDAWCHQCAKCLFVYLLFSAFLDRDIVAHEIFDHDLLADQSLAPIFEELMGLKPAKPLECVGTREESQAAFYLVCKKCEHSEQPLPSLVATYKDAVLGQRDDWEDLVHKLSTNWHDDHSLPNWAEEICKKALQNLLTNN